ncbi:hypothetical protein D0T53_10965 [Dysgonomonas sp. 216]|uniref:hypothetical protein n=1 Tax=Dysgonomonas sp. 216 TaxID=2302934 RepID=UPI0013D001B0|nr:hypothetical protein [Dysgonomonas sp. 216]NDW19425.1 hypothetical protein [Dysgonomonas sp. 216]
MDDTVEYFQIQIKGAIDFTGYIPVNTKVIFGGTEYDLMRVIENAIIDAGKDGFVEFNIENPSYQYIDRKKHTVKFDRDLLILSTIVINRCVAYKGNNFENLIKITSEKGLLRVDQSYLSYDYNAGNIIR